MSKNLNVFYSVSSIRENAEGGDSMCFMQLVGIAKSKRILEYILKYKSVTLYVPDFNSFLNPFMTLALCRIISRGKCLAVNLKGEKRRITPFALLRELFHFCLEHAAYRGAVARVDREVESLRAAEKPTCAPGAGGTPVYLRSDLSYGYVAGGSLGHIAGVLNNMSCFFHSPPLFITTDVLPTVSGGIPPILVNESLPFRNVRNVSLMTYNDIYYRSALNAAGSRDVCVIYQRSALNCYAGVKLALELGVPLVLEYNGSEVWIADHWGGKKLKAGWLSEKIEMLSFEKASLIVCVSRPLRDELVSRGVPSEKILVNPNGVNEQMYTPDINGAAVRDRYGFASSDVVIGFIGTFGAWHGAEVLAEAFTQISKSSSKAKLLMIGDGERAFQTRQILRAEVADGCCVFTGMVPQKEGPEYLAACDVLVSPQIRNPDGTPFFGSPTKLFEYMAMGKSIVASNLDQIGESIVHGETGILVTPGDTAALAEGLIQLAGDAELRKRLGANARKAVLAQYTWKEHTKKIFDRLYEICSLDIPNHNMKV